MDASAVVPLYRFWRPRYWPLWLGLLILRILVLLPYRWQMGLGRRLGRLIVRFMPERQKIAAANLRLCFPDLSAGEIDQLLRKHIESLGMGIFEIAMALWLSDTRAEKLIRIDGIENITEPLSNGQGVVLLSGHFPSSELTGRTLKHRIPGITAGMYRPMKNPLVDQIMRRGRARSVQHLILKDDIRQMIRVLRKGGLTWYAPDQSFSGKGSELLPFFGEPAMTNTALTNIARISHACVVLYVPLRLENDAGYYAEIKPALENFPTDDPAADALRVNQLLEEKIRLAPEQYYWIHRRFKNRPAPHPDPYSSDKASAQAPDLFSEE